MNSKSLPSRNDEILIITTTNKSIDWSKKGLMASGGSSSSILSGRLLGVSPTGPLHVVHVSSSNSVDGTIPSHSVKRFNNGENKTPLLSTTPIIRQAAGTTIVAICSSCGENSKMLDACEHCSTPFQPICGYPPSSPIVNTPIYQIKHSIKPNILTKPAFLVSKPNSMSKQYFYGSKLLEQSKYFQKASPRKAIQLPVISGNQQYKKKVTHPKKEPVCLTISSDEEPDELEKTLDTEMDITSNNTDKAARELIANRVNMIRDKDGRFLNDKGEPIVATQNQSSVNSIRIDCRSIRIGSYKVHYQGPKTLFVDVTRENICFTVPTITDANSQVLVTISKDDIPSILSCFDKKLYVIYIYTTSGLGGIIRTRLQMTKANECYYDPLVEDETRKRITIIPVLLEEHHMTFLREIFHGGKMKEINQAQANELLVRSTPQGVKQHMIRVTPASNTRSQAVIQQATSSNAVKPVVKKLLTYPPPPQTGGITVTSEDLLCLNEGEFLNDVIIDFYLKYLLTEIFSELDQKRTYIFSSFFFNRLTQRLITKPTRSGTKEQTSLEARHSRVKTWTRHVDIFEKDFLIVPVNQTSHWFLAIICFPGLVSEASRLRNINAAAENAKLNETSPTGDPSDCQMFNTTEEPSNIEGEEDLESPLTSQTNSQSYLERKDNCNVVTSTSEISLRKSFVMEELAKDYAEADDNFLNKPVIDHRIEHSYSSSSLQSKPDSTPSSPGDIGDDKEPCIIIFDSLPGTARWRIVQSLRDYVQVEYRIKKGPDVIFDRFSMKGLSARVPRQTNFHDCGVYLLQYVESFFGKPFRVKTPLPGLENWFTEEGINKKRDYIKELILNLQQKNVSSTPQ